MSRLPYLRYDDLDPAAKEVWDAIVGSRADAMLNEQGGLTGPFNALVQAPAIGRHLTSLGLALRYETSIPRRLTEVAILTVGARWQAEFEWWAHAQMARRHGVSDAVIEAIRQGEDPPFEAADEQAVHTAARQLAQAGHLSQPAYDAVQQLLGDSGVVELITLCGYYTLISFVLNGLAVPLPPDATPAWDAASE
jgi:4-carboxymuconolactone decarboxylase